MIAKWAQRWHINYIYKVQGFDFRKQYMNREMWRKTSKTNDALNKVDGLITSIITDK